MADSSAVLLVEMLRRRRGLLLGIVAAVVLLGGLLLSRSVATYEAGTQVTFAPAADAPASADLVRLLVGSRYALQGSAPATIQTAAVLVDRSPREVRRAVSVIVPTNSATVEVDVELDDPADAATVANSVATSLIAAADDDPLVEATLIAAAVPPSSPAGPGDAVWWVVIAVGAVGLAVGITLLVEQADPRLRTAREVSTATDLPVLGTIAGDSVLRHRPTEVLAHPVVGAQLRMLRSNLGLLVRRPGPSPHGGPDGSEDRATNGSGPDSARPSRHGGRGAGSGDGGTRLARRADVRPALARTARTIVVTSPNEGDGRTTVTVLLAAAAARAGLRVLVVDGDLRRPALAGRLDCDPGNDGLDVALRGGHLAEPLPYTGMPGLFVLPTERDLAAGDRLASGMAKVLDELKADFDLILVDSPRLLGSDEARTIAAVGDETLVVLATLTPRDDLEQTMAILRTVGARPIGLVLNREARGAADREVTA